ncbi:DnaD domain protein [Cohnella lupini]|uniref:Replicative DNA helicase loader DnaB n=1 Tax=Cohnella lupini TaxID=1294267 RepID=A0A3D9I659_9BACL|nr:DnaD domain protein [Cohnella lupini]RED57150.1 replicative DNA helicase loader DnaB [Cohnella lupini]
MCYNRTTIIQAKRVVDPAMRVSNIMEFTENHRYFTNRDFALSGLDRKVFITLYQPMVGAVSAAFYQLLYHQFPEESAGYSVPEPQRKLFLGLGLELNATGRQTAIDAASRLEAVGLLQVFRNHNPLTEESIYEYVLQRPLSYTEFFSNYHLTLLLRDRIGKSALLELKDGFEVAQPPELARFVNREEATMPFYEMFRIGSATLDPELEMGWQESATAKERTPAFKTQEKIRHGEMMLRFPRGSANRSFVERLNRAPESMAQLNYLAYKFNLEVPEICRLLDEDGIFHSDGTLTWDELQNRANLMYRQDRKRDEERERFLARGEERQIPVNEEPAATSSSMQLDIPERFQEEVTVARYNEMLRREPYTRMLERYFPGAVPDPFVRIFERIDLNYKLPEPVINVLIHYVFSLGHAQRLTKSFVDSIASNMLAKGIDTLDKAAMYIREQEKLNVSLERKRRGEETARDGGSSFGSQGQARSGRRKPAMSVVKDNGPVKEMSPEELERMRELARKMKEES